MSFKIKKCTIKIYKKLRIQDKNYYRVLIRKLNISVLNLNNNIETYFYRNNVDIIERLIYFIKNKIDDGLFDNKKRYFEDFVNKIIYDTDFCKELYIKSILFSDRDTNGINKDITIDHLNLSVRAYNSLRRAGFKYIRELEECSTDRLYRVRNLGEKCVQEVMEKVKTFKIPDSLPEDFEMVNFVEKEKSLISLNLSQRAYNVLKNEGYYSISEIIKLSKGELRNFRNLGTKTYEEIIKAIESRGYEFAPEKIAYLESDNIENKDVQYNLIAAFRLLEKIFGTQITKNFDDDKTDEFFARLDNSLNTLKEKEKLVLIERMGLKDGTPKTLEDTAYKFGLTRERIRQIENKAINKLKDIRRTNILRQYVKIKNEDVSEITDYILDCVFNNET